MIRLLVILLHFPILIMGQGRLHFVGESIDFEISNERFYVNGIYIIANSKEKPVSRPLLFPFAKDADSVEIHRVFNLSNNQNIVYQDADNGFIFNVFIHPHDTLYINISYSQRIALKNEYILTTTQAWGQPLQTADYSLKVDDLLSIESFSYEPDWEEGAIYFWRKTNFMPEKDFWVIISDTK